MIPVCVHSYACLIQKKTMWQTSDLVKRITLLFFITKSTDMLLHVRAFYFDYLNARIMMDQSMC